MAHGAAEQVLQGARLGHTGQRAEGARVGELSWDGPERREADGEARERGLIIR